MAWVVSPGLVGLGCGGRIGSAWPVSWAVTGVMASSRRPCPGRWAEPGQRWKRGCRSRNFACEPVGARRGCAGCACRRAGRREGDTASEGRADWGRGPNRSRARPCAGGGPDRRKLSRRGASPERPRRRVHRRTCAKARAETARALDLVGKTLTHDADHGRLPDMLLPAHDRQVCSREDERAHNGFREKCSTWKGEVSCGL